MLASSMRQITDRLVKAIEPLKFSEPVTHIYNPLQYARQPYDKYLELYADSPKEVLLIGMNPGPFGMAQTGVPFGEIAAVKDWLQINEPVGVPPQEHPKRPVEGFASKRSEVSGKRVWAWAKNRYSSPDKFFAKFLVLNYCPLVFMEESSRNRTPDKLPKTERDSLFAACDKALKETTLLFQPKFVIGVGAFAEKEPRRPWMICQ